MSHGQVVELIRRNPEKVSLLLLDPQSRNFYENTSTVVHSEMPEVRKLYSWNHEVDVAAQPPLREFYCRFLKMSQGCFEHAQQLNYIAFFF